MEKNKKPIKVMVIDDHPMVIEGLRVLIADHTYIVISHSCTLGQSAIELLQAEDMDIVLLDINLPDINGTELCLQITKTYPQTKVIGISTYSEASIIHQIIQNGAKGYLLKNVSADELVNAIYMVYENEEYFSPEVKKVLSEFSVKGFPRLTRREKEVLELIASGITTQQIADKLFVSPLTIETHRRNLMHKFGVNNAPALIRTALEHKLL